MVIKNPIKTKQNANFEFSKSDSGILKRILRFMSMNIKIPENNIDMNSNVKKTVLISVFRSYSLLEAAGKFIMKDVLNPKFDKEKYVIIFSSNTQIPYFSSPNLSKR